MNEVGERGGKVAAKEQVKCREGGKAYHNYPTGNSVHYFKKAGQTVVNRGGIGNQQNEYNDSGRYLQPVAAVALLEEIGHGFRGKASCHIPRALGEHQPSYQRAENGVADTDPNGCKAERSAELSGISYENDGRKICSTVSKGGHPAAKAVFACHKEVVDGAGAILGINRNSYHRRRVNSKNNVIERHGKNPRENKNMTNYSTFRRDCQ